VGRFDFFLTADERNGVFQRMADYFARAGAQP